MPERTRIRDLATSDYYAVPADETVAQAIERIRVAPHYAVSYLYVVDDQSRLVGVVPLRKLLTAPPDTRIGDVLSSNVIALPADGESSLLADFFATYRLLAFPVIDADRRLVGSVQADAFNEGLVGEFEGRVRHDWLASAGVTEEEHRATTLRILRLRLPWILVTLASGLVSAVIAGRFQWALERLVIMAFFVPVVLLISESVGMQTSAVVVSAMGEDIPPKLRPLLLREMGAAALLGLACGCLIGAVSYAWLRQGGFSLVLAVTLTLTVTTASALAVAVPGLFKRIGLDPSHAAAPLTLAVTDNLTLLTYLTVTSRLLA